MEILAAITMYDLDSNDIQFILDDIKGKDYLTCHIEDTEGQMWLVVHTGRTVPTAEELTAYLTT